MFAIAPLTHMRAFRFAALAFLSAATLTVSSELARADASAEPLVVGRWITIDDNTHQPAGLVSTWVDKGKLYGRVEKILKAGAPQDAKCERCSGYFKDKPIIGLVFMWGMSQDGDEWTGGEILDPDNGSTYRCKVKAVGSDHLDVRGYIGISLFGRTQTWNRAPAGT